MEKSFRPSRPMNMRVAVVSLLGGAFLVAVFIRVAENPFFYRTDLRSATKDREGKSREIQLIDAIVHYATAKIRPQQTLKEISVSFDVLKTTSPCNFLVFGLGHDSIMWAALNVHGSTLFLEESPSWVEKVLSDAPYLRAQTVTYRTQLREADELLKLYHEEPDCWPEKYSFLRGNEKCRLALNMLSEEVYNTEWDLIMIDAPRGCFPKAPGRMAAIYSAAVMARNRKGSGVTHVFLHDVDRKVENMYSEKFLCRKYMVEQVGRLRHYEIPPSKNDQGMEFC